MGDDASDADGDIHGSGMSNVAAAFARRLSGSCCMSETWWLVDAGTIHDVQDHIGNSIPISNDNGEDPFCLQT